MENKDLKRFRLLFDEVRQALGELRAQSSALTAAIEGGGLVPEASAARMKELLEAYQDRSVSLRRSGEALSIPLEGSLSDIGASLKAAEEAARLASRQNAVLEYFRLASKEESVKTALEDSKRLLEERRGTPEALEPFLLVTKAVSEQYTLTDDEFDEIYRQIGRAVARALERGQLYIDGDAPAGRNPDGASPFPGPETETPAQAAEDGGEEASSAAPSGASDREAQTGPEAAAAPPASGPLWPGFSGYSGAAAVTFTDVPAKQLGASKFISMARQKPESVNAIFLLANQILLEQDDLADKEAHYYSPSEELRGLLLRQGYAMELTLECGEAPRTFLTLTSKGWACFKKAETAKFLGGVRRMIPPAFRLSVSELTPKNVMRLVLLHDHYSRRTPKLNYMLFPDTAERFFLAEHLHDEDASRKTAAAIFEAGDEERDLLALQSVIDALGEQDTLRVIVCSREDLRRLDPRLDFSSVREEQVSYCLRGEPGTALDHSGAPRREDPTDGETEEETEEGPAEGEREAARDAAEPGPDAPAPEPEPFPEKTPGSAYPEIAEQYRQEGLKMLCRGKNAEALALFRALTRYGGEAEAAYRRLAYALDDPAMEKHYRYTELLESFSDRSGELGYDALHLSASLRLLFSEDVRSEPYHVKTCVQSLERNAVYEAVPQLKDLVYCLGETFENLGRGFEPAVLNALMNVKSQELQIGQYRSKAAGLSESRLEETNIGNKRIKGTRRALFSAGSLLHKALALTVQGTADGAAWIRKTLGAYLDAEYAPGQIFKNEDLADGAVNALIDEAWEATEDKTAHLRKDSLKGSGRTNILCKVREILTVCLTWASLTEGAGGVSLDGKETQFRRYHAKVEKLLLQAQRALDAWTPEEAEHAAGAAVLRSTAAELAERMKGERDIDRDRFYYISFLKGNYVELGEDYLPEMELEFDETAPFSLCKRIAEQSAAEEPSWDQVLERIFESPAEGRDYGHAALIRDYLTERDPDFLWPVKYDIPLNVARSKALLSSKDSEFMARLEMAQNYGWVEDAATVDRIVADMELRRQHCIEHSNYGFYFRTMGAYLSRLERDAERHRVPWERRLGELREKSGTDYPVFAEIERLIRKNMYTVAQDYMDQVEKEGLRELPKTTSLADGDDALDRFIAHYTEYYNDAKGSERTRLADIFRQHHRGVENSLIKTGAAMLEAWPKSAGGAAATSDKIRSLFVQMGLPVRTVSCKADTHYYMTFQEQEISADHPHPIGAYGSEMLNRGLHVFLLFGSKDATTMNSAVRQLMTASVNGASVILTDTQLSLADKRKLAQIIKEENQNRSPYLILDRVTILHLAEQPQTERWNIFLKCALPFHYLNPFTENSVVEIPPDMFIGRRRELEQVVSPGGANLIYGGRQLGKTALLHHVRKLEDRRTAGKWSVYIDIKTESADSAAQSIYEKLQDEGFLPQDTAAVDWRALARAITNRIRKGTPEVERFLLLLDEADHFLADCRNSEYAPVVYLKQIQTDTGNRFKFVLAGLHNVLRFYTADSNSALAHLGSITIPPLPFKEAGELLERPLSYLGFKLKQEDTLLIAQILSSTNYYPGLIQLYASRLVHSVCRKDYSGADERPPYWLREDQILRLLQDQDFLDNIKSKLMITLGVDQDEEGYYQTLAYTLAYCYFRMPEGALNGYTASQIREMCRENEIRSIAGLTLEQVEVLLEELIVLNVLRKNEMNGEGYYIFNRAAFRHMLGDEDAIEDKLLEMMEKEQTSHGG